MEFYETFLEFCSQDNSIFSDEYKKVVDYVSKGYSGKGWNHYDSKLGEIFWPIEEATWLRLISNKELLVVDTTKFLDFLEQKFKFSTNEKEINDLVKFQIFLLTTNEGQKQIKSEQFSFDWKEYFVNDSELIEIDKNYFYKNLIIEDDTILWGYRTIWYGRQSKNYKFHPEKLEENEIILVEK